MKHWIEVILFFSIITPYSIYASHFTEDGNMVHNKSETVAIVYKLRYDVMKDITLLPSFYKGKENSKKYLIDRLRHYEYLKGKKDAYDELLDLLE